MRAQIQKAASLTTMDLQQTDDQTLKAAARIVRTFLLNFQSTLGRWRPLRYAVGAILGVLDVLLEEEV